MKHAADEKKQTRKRSRIAGYRVKHRPGRAKPWIFIRTDEAGKRHEQGFEKEADARKALKEAEADRLKYGETTTGFTPADFAELNEARRILEGLNVTLPAVAVFYRDHGKRGCPQITVAEAVEIFLTEKEGHALSERHTRDLRGRLGHFAKDHGEKIVSRVDSAVALAWIKTQGGKPRSMKNNLVAVMNWANFAVRRGWTDKAPEIHESDLPKVAKASKETFTVEQARAFFKWLEANRPQWCAFFAISAFAGIRNAEAERFRSEWIDFDRKRLVIPKEICKTGDDWILVGLPENLWAWLRKYRFKGAIPCPTNRKAMTMRSKLVTAKIVKSWPDNGLRHSFATYHISAHESADKTALLTRHQSAATLWRNYLRSLVSKPEAEAYFGISPR